MTGFGSHTELMFGREITIEIKSVNSRYLDLNIKTPRMYTFLEDIIKKTITKHVSRGKVDVFVSINCLDAYDSVIDVNTSILNQYVSALKEISNCANVPFDVTTTFLSKYPDVLSHKKTDTCDDEMLISVTKTLDKALSNFNDMRQKEASSLKNDIALKSNQILNLVSFIENNSQNAVEKYRQRLFEKLSEILNDSQIPMDRVLTETAIFADKVAVDEETVRLRSHILQLEQFLVLSEPIGRKLDFLIQEINREVNTIGSKCQDIQITNSVIELKSLVEKVREQVQNLE